MYIGNVCGLCVLNKSKATTAAPVVKKMAHIKALNLFIVKSSKVFFSEFISGTQLNIIDASKGCVPRH